MFESVWGETLGHQGGVPFFHGVSRAISMAGRLSDAFVGGSCRCHTWVSIRLAFSQVTWLFTGESSGSSPPRKAGQYEGSDSANILARDVKKRPQRNSEGAVILLAEEINQTSMSAGLSMSFFTSLRNAAAIAPSTTR